MDRPAGHLLTLLLLIQAALAHDHHVDDGGEKRHLRSRRVTPRINEVESETEIASSIGFVPNKFDNDYHFLNPSYDPDHQQDASASEEGAEGEEYTTTTPLEIADDGVHHEALHLGPVHIHDQNHYEHHTHGDHNHLHANTFESCLFLCYDEMAQKYGVEFADKLKAEGFRFDDCPQYDENYEGVSAEDRRKLGTTNEQFKKWNIPEFRLPNGLLQIPYALSVGLEQRTLDTIDTALRTIEASTGVLSFTPRATQSSYILFQHTTANMCAATVGRGNPARVYLGWCKYETHLGSIIHEVLHTLGFWHEQSRPDRDEWVRIATENIDSNALNNFGKMTTVDSLGSPYDYGSIMHYPSWAFTVNGQDTIIPLRPGGETIGNRAGLSSHDIDQLRLMHQCSTGSRNLNDLTINNLCSVDCKCWEYALGNCDSNDDCMGDAHCGDTPVEFFEGAAAGTVPERMCLTAGLTSRPSMSPSGSRLPSVEPSISNEPTMTMNPTSSPTGRPTSKVKSTWYIDWNISKCVMNCLGPAPCGGYGQWVAFYDTMEQCCDAHLYWMNTYDGCSTLPEETEVPTPKPSEQPTASPTTGKPSSSPTQSPTNGPTTGAPTTSPTTAAPSSSPSKEPTDQPTTSPSNAPSVSPTTAIPSVSPTKEPTVGPTTSPSKQPSASPTTGGPSFSPSKEPTNAPTTSPSKQPSASPTTGRPSFSPSKEPTNAPTTPKPTAAPTMKPTDSPVVVEWYVSWSQGGRCVRDCEGQRPCGGKKSIWQSGYQSVQSCCSTMSWKAYEACSFEIDGTTSTTTTSTIPGTGTTVTTTSTPSDTKWYPGASKCNNDGKSPSWQNNKYTEQSTCCSNHFSWDYNKCMGIKPTASYKWFVSWNIGKCVQECDSSEGGKCAGFVTGTWIQLHASPEACCTAHMNYKPRSQCT